MNPWPPAIELSAAERMVFLAFSAEVLVFLLAFLGSLAGGPGLPWLPWLWAFKTQISQGPPHMGTVLVPRARGTPALNPSPPRHGRIASLGGGSTQVKGLAASGKLGPPPHEQVLPAHREGVTII